MFSQTPLRRLHVFSPNHYDKYVNSMTN